MLKWLVLPMVVLAYIATTAGAAAPRDRDHDRLPDRWERKHHLSTTVPSAKRDPDRDRLKNRRELRLRTHPRRADTDRDRLRDGAEVRRFHTNPRKRDTDGEGFSDGCELRKGTNPRKRRSHPKRRCPKSRQEVRRHVPPLPPPPQANDPDGDGVVGSADQCPNDPGSEPNGCDPPPSPTPTADSDGDGVFNVNDDCPNVSGLRDNLGCPMATAPVSSSNPDGDAFAGPADFCPDEAGLWPDGCRGHIFDGGGGGSGVFYADCQFLNSGHVDPIVFPGQATAGHEHDFFGGPVDGNTTNDSLRAGTSSCTRITPDQQKSAYWVPALYVNGQKVNPASWDSSPAFNPWYRTEERRPGNIELFPPDFRAIAGNAAGGSFWAGDQVVIHANCQDGRAAQPGANGFPTCNTPKLELQLKFGDCSDGRSDSLNHRDHLAYSQYIPGTRTRACPPSHPIEVPSLQFFIKYPTTAGPTARLSTSMTATGHLNEFHGDFMNGWVQSELEKLVDNCLNRNRYCARQDTPVLGHG